jgi:hypothetical protein
MGAGCQSPRQSASSFFALLVVPRPAETGGACAHTPRADSPHRVPGRTLTKRHSHNRAGVWLPASRGGRLTMSSCRTGHGAGSAGVYWVITPLAGADRYLTLSGQHCLPKLRAVQGKSSRQILLASRGGAITVGLEIERPQRWSAEGGSGCEFLPGRFSPPAPALQASSQRGRETLALLSAVHRRPARTAAAPAGRWPS